MNCPGVIKRREGNCPGEKMSGYISSVTVPGMEMWDETVRGFLFSLFKKV